MELPNLVSLGHIQPWQHQRAQHFSVRLNHNEKMTKRKKKLHAVKHVFSLKMGKGQLLNELKGETDVVMMEVVYV